MPRAYTREMIQPDRFVRLPTKLLEALLRNRFSGAQWRILLWVIRQTLGWNRHATPFSWYRISKDLAMDRGGVVRAGHKLLSSGILCLDGDQIAVNEHFAQWQRHGAASQGDAMMPGVSVDEKPQPAMTGGIATDDDNQLYRCQKSSVFRRTKDSHKDRLKKYLKTSSTGDVTRQGFRKGAFSKSRHPAGAARPIPGKYDGLSQN
jgi:phage replication O-like protein O